MDRIAGVLVERPSADLFTHKSASKNEDLGANAHSETVASARLAGAGRLAGPDVTNRSDPCTYRIRRKEGFLDRIIISQPGVLAQRNSKVVDIAKSVQACYVHLRR